GVPLRPLVEAVDLELQTVEPEVEDQVTLEVAGRHVRHPLPAEVGVNRKPTEVRDPAADVRALEPHGPGALAVDLDDEDTESVRFGLGTFDLGADLVLAVRADCREERLDLVVGHEADEEVDVVLAGTTEGDGHGRRPYQRRHG